MEGAFANPIHWIFAIAVLVLVFGPSKLGDIGGALGKSVKEFKSSVNDADAAPVQTRSVTKVTAAREEPAAASVATPASVPVEPRPSMPDYRP